MLNINPSRRISAADALKHPWIYVSYYIGKHRLCIQCFFFAQFVWFIHRFVCSINEKEKKILMMRGC
jgi:hypothetical protein